MYVTVSPMQASAQHLYHSMDLKLAVFWSFFSCGADLNVKNDRGETAYEMATKAGYENLVKRFAAALGQSQLQKMIRPRNSAEWKLGQETRHDVICTSKCQCCYQWISASLGEVSISSATDTVVMSVVTCCLHILKKVWLSISAFLKRYDCLFGHS